MSNHDKRQEVYDKLYAFGGPKLGIGVFIFPFMPIIFAANHVGYLITLPLGLYASYAVIDTTEKLKALIIVSKVFQKKLLWCSVINLLAIWLNPIFGGLVTICLSVYCHLSASKDYERYVSKQNI
ncbi:hypothetical protein JF541_19600 [Marinobacter hydrocarbonoclasticus]|uniref:hypothetical protein n=1 Tax=Gammaproteobacteria TaxID=1236 RepID=UPI00140D67C7|nr:MULTISPECIES: hypothetical protein [Gammaproteobacteria]MBN8241364.1 hypothetical protein [Marinobacter nauticus]NHN39995.1 hypothetical protein [Pseudomaricurvus alcaniphilus]